MKTAKEMFDKMGWQIKRNDEFYLIWYFDLKECDTKNDCYIVFDKTKFVLDQRYISFKLDRNEDIFVSQCKLPIPTINENAKAFLLSVQHHQAITQQMKELGWLDD